MVCRGSGGLYCPYCESDGRHFIEATEKTIKEWVKDMDKGEREKIRKLLFDGEDK